MRIHYKVTKFTVSSIFLKFFQIPRIVPQQAGIILFRTEDSVTGIAKSRADVGILVEFSVKGATVDLYIRMCLVETFQTFRSCDDAHELSLIHI